MEEQREERPFSSAVLVAASRPRRLGLCRRDQRRGLSLLLLFATVINYTMFRVSFLLLDFKAEYFLANLKDLNDGRLSESAKIVCTPFDTVLSIFAFTLTSVHPTDPR